MKAGITLEQLADEIERQHHNKLDVVLNQGLLQYRTRDKNDGGEMTFQLPNKPGPDSFPLTDLARSQLAERTGIPQHYFERMRTEQPSLLDHNVNTWLHDEGTTPLMCRMLDGKLRALLSNRYRRLDHFELFQFLFPFLNGLEGAKFESLQVTEKRLYIKVILPRLQCDVAVGDAVQCGVVISNSEVGCGRLTVQPLLYRLVCRNGMIIPDLGLKRTHLGRQLTLSDNIDANILTEESMKADDHALFLMVRDVVQHTLSAETLEVMSSRLKATLGIPITGDPVQSVQVLANRYGLDEGEKSGVLKSLITGAQLSAFGLVNALTAFSQEVADYDRATEFEAMGGELLSLDKEGWKPIVAAAKQERKKSRAPAAA